MKQKLKNILHPLKLFILMIEGFFISNINKVINPNFKCTKETKRCFSNPQSPNYKYEYFGKDTPPCCVTNLYSILKDVTEVLEKHNLEYFISFGTLLGAVRHGGLIPWDTDVDIVIPEKDKEKIYKILQEQLGDSYLIQEDREDDIIGSLLRVNLSKENRLHVDLFTYIDGNKEDIVFGCHSSFLKTDIYPLQKMKFYETSFFAPQNSDKQLKLFYGDVYMKYAYKQWAFDKSRFELKENAPAKIDR